MAINIYDHYQPRAGAADSDYPQGKVVNRSAPGQYDGTPLDEALFNDYVGFTAALLSAGNVSASGAPDTANASDRLTALINTARETVLGNMYGSSVKAYTGGLAMNQTTNRIISTGTRFYMLKRNEATYTTQGVWSLDEPHLDVMGFDFHSLKLGTTSQVGVVQLNNTVTSTSATQAATAAAVKAANDNANGRAMASHSHAGTDVAQATTSARGTVQLNTSVGSTSTTQAATPSAVKSAYDRAGDAGHVHTAAQIGTAYSGVPTYALGSLVWARRTVAGSTITIGQTIAGSALAPTGVPVILSSDGNLLGTNDGGATMSGTWKALGTCKSTNGSRYNATLFVRTA